MWLRRAFNVGQRLQVIRLPFLVFRRGLNRNYLLYLTLWAVFGAMVRRASAFFCAFQGEFLARVVSSAGFVKSRVVGNQARDAIQVVQSAGNHRLVRLSGPVLPYHFQYLVGYARHLILGDRRRLRPCVLPNFFLWIFVRAHRLQFRESYVVFRFLNCEYYCDVFDGLPAITATNARVPCDNVRSVRRSKGNCHLLVRSLSDREFLDHYVCVRLCFSSFQCGQARCHFSVRGRVRPFVVFGQWHRYGYAVTLSLWHVSHFHVRRTYSELLMGSRSTIRIPRNSNSLSFFLVQAER